MEISFGSKEVERCLTDLRYCKKEMGELAKILQKRYAQLRAFQNLKELFDSGIDKPEFLKGSNEVSYHLSANVRIILGISETYDEKLLSRLGTIKKITIKGAKDDHGDAKGQWILH